MKEDDDELIKAQADELINALESFLAIAPSGDMLRLYVGNKLDNVAGVMMPEEFVAFARDLLAASKKLRKTYK